MSRLIREADLLAEIEEWKRNLFPNDDTEDVTVYNVLCRMEDIINDSDEAYDVEAVVRELEECEFCPAIIEGAYCDVENRDCTECFRGKAIEIVRGGRNE